MSKVLFLSVPSHGNVNPTLGLVSELIKQGEEVVYFSSTAFQKKIEATGAFFRSYSEDFQNFNGAESFTTMHQVIRSAPAIVADILQQARNFQFDYLIHSAGFPFTKIIAQALKLPTVSSLAISAGFRNFRHKREGKEQMVFAGNEAIMKTYKTVSRIIEYVYDVTMPRSIVDLLFNTGDLNLVYTSKYFAPDADFLDDSYKFVGPPIYDRKEDLDFPFEKLQGRKVIYISLGTMFSNHHARLYEVFFKSLADIDALIVLAAFQVDLSAFQIPANFIVRNYVPQPAILKYAHAAVTHAGMNGISDLVSNHIPFVAIPLGADQPELALQAETLGATISLDAETLDPDILRTALEKVQSDPSYLRSIIQIDKSFKEAGGYKKAVAEIFSWKATKEIKRVLVRH